MDASFWKMWTCECAGCDGAVQGSLTISNREHLLSDSCFLEVQLLDQHSLECQQLFREVLRTRARLASKMSRQSFKAIFRHPVFEWPSGALNISYCYWGLVSVYPGAPRLLAFQEILLQQACTESLQKLSSGMLPAWHGLNNSARTVHKTTTSHRISLEFRTPALHEADKTPARRESSAVSC